MPPFSAQNMPSPVEHLGKSRLLAVIIGLIALCFILAAVFVYMQQNEQRMRVASARNSLMAAQALISAPNPPSGLSPGEIKARQALLNH
jgi:cbb3-type cytochrome oxidase subunit 3